MHGYIIIHTNYLHLSIFDSCIIYSCYIKESHIHVSELLKGESEGLLQLPTDKCLLEDEVFRPYVELYARVSIVTAKS